MSLAGRLSRLVPDLSETVAHFPTPALISVLLFIYAQLDIAFVVSDGNQPGNHVYLGGAAAFIAAGAAHYFGQSHSWPKLTERALAVLAALIAGALAYWDTGLRTSHLFLFAGLVPHAYAVKILLNGVLPEGQIGIMVTIFALGGTASWLVAWPWRDTGTWLLRFFMRYWFWFTIVPAILLVIAVSERIATYGVTPERYGIAVIALWLTIVTLYLAIRRNRADMRMLLGSFALLVLVGSAGPLGANSVSIASQFGRLLGFFEEEKLLMPDGHIIAEVLRISDEGKREIDAILGALNAMGGLDKVRPFFAGRADDPFAGDATGWDALTRIRKVLNLDQWTLTSDQVSFGAATPVAQDITGQGRLVGPFQVYSNTAVVQQGDIWAKSAGDNLEIAIGDRKWSIPVRVLLERIKAEFAKSSQIPMYQQRPIIYDVEPGMRLIIIQTQGTLNDKQAYLSMGFWVILQR
jgi:hypothetical protein